MSTSYSDFVKFNHLNDCRQEGCPGHVLRIVYHNTSDTLSLEVDGEQELTLDPNTFEAAIQAHETSGRHQPRPSSGGGGGER